MRRVALVYGTRPEAIKMGPLVAAIDASPRLSAHVITTGQHQAMLQQVHAAFGIRPDTALDVFVPGQGLSELTARVMSQLPGVLSEAAADAVVVQGDTTTAFLAGLCAFYAQTPLIHLEAGLRTGNPYNPFPEEMNRRLVGRLATLHLAPTALARANLLAEGIDPGDIVYTGNTVIDALMAVTERPYTVPGELRPVYAHPGRVVLLTAHRRESWGEPLDRVAAAVDELAGRYPQTLFVAPLHPNPLVRRSFDWGAASRPNVLLLEPLSYVDFSHLIKRCHLVLTDSGGIQEEAPALGKPVLVLRDTTERPEAVEAGTARLVGTDTELIVTSVAQLMDDPDRYAAMANAVNPFGDGRAAERSAAAIEHLFGLGPRPEPFEARLPAAAPMR